MGDSGSLSKLFANKHISSAQLIEDLCSLTERFNSKEVGVEMDGNMQHWQSNFPAKSLASSLRENAMTNVCLLIEENELSRKFFKNSLCHEQKRLEDISVV